MTEREEKFEAMLRSVLQEYDTTVGKLEKSKAEDKTKTATYRQLLGDKRILHCFSTSSRSEPGKG